MHETHELAIWTEKYRPKTFSEVKGQKEIVARVKAFVETRNMPHLLFAGPAGVGKTTLALVIVKQFFKDSWRENFLELNASDTRGIDVIRERVKDFARTKAIGDVPFKIIYLDESDALTKDAQHALRRTMENYTQTTRFILSCVTPDTKILLPDEREISMKKFIAQYEKNPREINVQNISNNQKDKEDLVLASVTLPASSIGKKVLEIRTMTGRKLKMTEDHKLLTINGWKEAGNLTKEDKLLVYPHLEQTTVEDNTSKIIDLNEFIDFVSQTEENAGLKTLKNASTYRQVTSKEKDKILKKIAELKEAIKEDKGLTVREFQLYNFIKKEKGISRKELQNKMGITRMGINYLLPSVEKKGFIKRTVNKNIHSFTASSRKPLILRNHMDIRRSIEKEFNIKISYSAVRKSDLLLDRGRVDRVLGELKRKKLLDVTYNDIEKVGVLARLCGFMLGDGHIVRNNIRLHFSGNREALRIVQKDLSTLDYKNYSNIKSVTLRNKIGEREFEGTSTSFTLDSRTLSLLLQYFGVPAGDKTIVSFKVPPFIKNGTKFVKREFIRALFGCDADKPNFKGMNFAALSLRQNKSDFLKQNILDYYAELSNILSEFDVDSYVNVWNKGEIRRKDDVSVLTFSLIVRPNNENLFRYFSRIGYVYEKYKKDLACLSAEYLRHKINVINVWKEKSKLLVLAVQGGKGISETAKEFDVTTDFVSNQLKGKDVHLPHKQFLSVNEWIKKYQYNDLLFINEIDEIKNSTEDLVMDLTCQKDHNFITNGLISHNCNYSSKIIDPIQSRCTVFRFKPLDKKDIFSIIDNVAKAEKLSIDEKAKEALYYVSGGDVRRLENLLQSSAVIDKKITEKLIFEVASFAEPKEVIEAIEACVKGSFKDAKKKILDIMLNQGLSGLDIIRQVQKECWNISADDRIKLEMVKQCGEAEFRMIEGADEFIQLEALLANFVLLNSK